MNGNLASTSTRHIHIPVFFKYLLTILSPIRGTLFRDFRSSMVELTAYLYDPYIFVLKKKPIDYL